MHIANYNYKYRYPIQYNLRTNTPIEHSTIKQTAGSQLEGETDPSILSDKFPDSFSISVIMESKPSSHPWADEVWDAKGIVASADDVPNPDRIDGKKDVVITDKNEVKIIEQGDSKQLIYSGLSIRLFLDECESYYHNMMSPEPGCFIVAREEDEDGNETNMPIPVLVTLSFDEAHSYLEGDDTVYAVPIPAELYLWAEAYVLENYVAEKRVKRKRVDWKNGDKRNSSSHEPAFDGPKTKNASPKEKG